jgi:cell division protein YceG involved in septum cleavage
VAASPAYARRYDRPAYDTESLTGLPPGPIGAAGEILLRAALEPQDDG